MRAVEGGAQREDAAIRPGGATVTLREQILDDTEASGLTILIERTPSGEGRLRVLGDLPFGNRDFAFDAEGQLVGAGTSTHACRRPTWLQVVD